MLRMSWDVAHIRPPVTAAQLLAPGFAERKLIWAVEVVRWAQRTHEEGQRAAARSHPPVAPYTR